MHLALDVATFSRFRLYRNSIPRGASAWLGVAVEQMAMGGFLTLELINSDDASARHVLLNLVGGEIADERGQPPSL